MTTDSSTPDAATTTRVRGARIWSAITAVIGLTWAFGGAGFPFGVRDERAREVGSLLASADATVTGVVVAAFGVATALLAVLAVRGFRQRWFRPVCWSVGVVSVLVVADIRVIQNFAYLFFGYTGLWDRPLLYMVFSIVGGGLWAGVAATAAGNAGIRTEPIQRWLLRHRVGVTYAAAALALPYPVTRIAWAVGIPLGMPESAVAGADLTLRLGESLLGGLAVGGAVLTVGLVRPWGTVFPRWTPVLRGRTVPIWFAAVPGAWASVLIVQAGLRVLAWTLAGDTPLTTDEWGAGAPGLFWLPWGVAVGAATYAYVLSRRKLAIATIRR
jgi:hypothetical protein